MHKLFSSVGKTMRWQRSGFISSKVKSYSGGHGKLSYSKSEDQIQIRMPRHKNQTFAVASVPILKGRDSDYNTKQ